ncbi:hypothetical protein GQ600_5109 [Phytophthora cactorum]|nr:hypothetical protein GQ600_5109 [Phytophthora cactorum]
MNEFFSNGKWSKIPEIFRTLTRIFHFDQHEASQRAPRRHPCGPCKRLSPQTHQQLRHTSPVRSINWRRGSHDGACIGDSARLHCDAVPVHRWGDSGNSWPSPATWVSRILPYLPFGDTPAWRANFFSAGEPALDISLKLLFS